MGDDNRKLVLGWLLATEDEDFDPKSSKELTDIEVYAISLWIGSQKDEDLGVYLPHPAWMQEALWVLGKAQYDYNKVDNLSPLGAACQLGGIITNTHNDELEEKTTGPQGEVGR